MVIDPSGYGLRADRASEQLGCSSIGIAAVANRERHLVIVDDRLSNPLTNVMTTDSRVGHLGPGAPSRVSTAGASPAAASQVGC